MTGGGSKDVRSAALLACVLICLSASAAERGLASWYGEEHRGKLMANGKPFDPDALTAASWSYALGTRVRVSLASATSVPRSVVVTITDRGPARRLVRAGRLIDLSQEAFRQLAPPELGCVAVVVQSLP